MKTTPRGEGQAIISRRWGRSQASISQAFWALGQHSTCSAQSLGPVPKEGRAAGASHSGDSTALDGKGPVGIQAEPDLPATVGGPLCGD